MSARHASTIVSLLVLVLLVAGCGGKKKVRQAPEISTRASFDKAIALLSQNQIRQATTALKNIDFTPETREEIEPLVRLALADATFFQGSALSFIDARNLYLEFVTLNSGHPLAPYAQLQAGVCSLKQVNRPSKDQTETLEAILELEAVEKRWQDSSYVWAARSMLRQARANLAESEYMIGRFYLKRKAYVAAVDRLSRVLDEYPDYPKMEKVLYHLASRVPVRPKSMSAILPSSWTNMLPGCRSAWKKPSSKIILNT